MTQPEDAKGRYLKMLQGLSSDQKVAMFHTFRKDGKVTEDSIKAMVAAGTGVEVEAADPDLVDAFKEIVHVGEEAEQAKHTTATPAEWTFGDNSEAKTKEADGLPDTIRTREIGAKKKGSARRKGIKFEKEELESALIKEGTAFREEKKENRPVLRAKKLAEGSLAEKIEALSLGKEGKMTEVSLDVFKSVNDAEWGPLKAQFEGALAGAQEKLKKDFDDPRAVLETEIEQLKQEIEDLQNRTTTDEDFFSEYDGVNRSLSQYEESAGFGSASDEDLKRKADELKATKEKRGGWQGTEESTYDAINNILGNRKIIRENEGKIKKIEKLIKKGENLNINQIEKRRLQQEMLIAKKRLDEGNANERKTLDEANRKHTILERKKKQRAKDGFSVLTGEELSNAKADLEGKLTKLKQLQNDYDINLSHTKRYVLHDDIQALKQGLDAIERRHKVLANQNPTVVHLAVSQLQDAVHLLHGNKETKPREVPGAKEEGHTRDYKGRKREHVEKAALANKKAKVSSTTHNVLENKIKKYMLFEAMVLKMKNDDVVYLSPNQIDDEISKAQDVDVFSREELRNEASALLSDIMTQLETIQKKEYRDNKPYLDKNWEDIMRQGIAESGSKDFSETIVVPDRQLLYARIGKPGDTGNQELADKFTALQSAVFAQSELVEGEEAIESVQSALSSFAKNDSIEETDKFLIINKLVDVAVENKLNVHRDLLKACREGIKSQGEEGKPN